MMHIVRSRSSRCLFSNPFFIFYGLLVDAKEVAETEHPPFLLQQLRVVSLGKQLLLLFDGFLHLGKAGFFYVLFWF